MADLAFVFHWSLRDMDAMDISELMAWRERARQRYEQQPE